MIAQIVEQIRTELARRGGVRTEVMGPLADEYGRQVSIVNQRLESCASLLAQGLRSEALQLAAVAPHLVDWAARLDFSEVDEWLELLEFAGLTTPPVVQRELVQQLQTAIVEEQPLEQLLREHRRLAIARAPLSRRLQLLRRIAEIDNATVHWLEDIETWETARLGEITHELSEATTEENLKAVQAIHRELSQVSWRASVPGDLQQRAARTSSLLVRKQRVARASVLAEELHAAFCGFEEERARRLRDEWLKITETLNGSLPADLHRRVEPAFAWLTDRDREIQSERDFAAALTRLEQDLSSGKSLPEVHASYDALASFQREFDPLLESRYRRYVAESTITTKRRSRVLIVSILCTTLLAGFIFAYVQSHRRKQDQLQSTAAEFSELIRETRLDEAQQFWDRVSQQHPQLVQATELVRLHAEFQHAREQDRQRAAEFQRLLQLADDADPARVDVTSLRKAAELAKTVEEKGEVFRLERALDQWRSQEQQQQFAGFSAELAIIGQAIDELERQAEVQDSAFGPLQARLQKLATDFPRAGAQAEDLLRVTTRRLTSLRDAHYHRTTQRTKRQSTLATIRQSRTLQDLRQAITIFVHEFPDDPLSADYQQSMVEQNLWNVTSEWNTLTDRLHDIGPNDVTADRTAQLIASCDALAGRLTHHPHTKHAESVRALLHSYATRDAKLTELVDFLSATFFKDLYTLHGSYSLQGEKRTGRVFVYSSLYTSRRDAWNQTRDGQVTGNIDAVVDDGGAVGKLSLADRLTVVQQPAETMRSLASSLTKDRTDIIFWWEQSLMERIKWIERQEGLDHWLKEILIERIVATMGEGNKAIDKRLRGVQARLKSRGTGRNQWFQVGEVRHAIDSRLRQELNRLARELPKPDAEFKALAAAKYQWAGSVQRDATDRPIVWIHTSIGADGTLVVAMPDETDPLKCTLTVIGEHRDGQVNLTTDQSIHLVAGRPVYWTSIKPPLRISSPGGTGR